MTHATQNAQRPPPRSRRASLPNKWGLCELSPAPLSPWDQLKPVGYPDPELLALVELCHLTGHRVDSAFADIGDPVSGSLQIVRCPEQTVCLLDAAGVFDDV